MFSARKQPAQSKPFRPFKQSRKPTSKAQQKRATSTATRKHAMSANPSTSPSTDAPKLPQIYERAHVIAPKGEHKRTVFFLHGLGDRGQSFIDIFEMLDLSNTKVVLPNAPIQPVTCNGGYKMPSWYDITALDDRNLQNDEDISGITLSVDKLVAGIEHEAALLDNNFENIVIGGFSQGSAVSQITSARFNKKLGGVIGLSGYALLASLGTDEKTNPVHNTETPWFIYHGTGDEVVVVDYARKSQDYWAARGLKANIQYVEEKGLGHSLSQREIVAIKKFLDSINFK